MKEFVKKLIGRLEEKKDEHLHDEEVIQGLGRINLASFCSAKARALDGAIEIVNQLAEEYNNDFCEWEYDDFEDSWQTSCGTSFSLCDSDREVTNYCPYCGKKIKVVE